MSSTTLPLRRCDDCPWDLCDQGQRCLRYEEQPIQRDDGLWDALDAAREAFPEVFQRFTFPITEEAS